MAEEEKKTVAKKAAPKAAKATKTETKKKATTKKSTSKKTTAKKTTAKKTTAKKTTAKKTTTKKAAQKAEPKKVAKKAKKVEEPVIKPVVTEAKCVSRDIRVTPRKVRLVIDFVRGKDVKVALGELHNMRKSAADPVAKAIKSAAANAVNNYGMDEDALYISEIQVSDGKRMKRYMPRAKGSASGITKRMSNLTVVVKERN